MLFHMYLRTTKKEAKIIAPLRVETKGSLRYAGYSGMALGLVLRFSKVREGWSSIALAAPM